MSVVPGSEASAERVPSIIRSKHGWLFLDGDTNRFMDVQFGDRPAWNETARTLAVARLRERAAWLGLKACRYFFIAAPEKSVIYPDRMPDDFFARQTPTRPAQMLLADTPDIVVDAETALRDGRSAGSLFFRGDTHVCWLGAWFLYRALAERLAKEGLIPTRDILPFGALTPSIAAYEGDLTAHLTKLERLHYETEIIRTLPAYGVDLAIQLELADAHRSARLVEDEGFYRQRFPKRETMIYERADRQGPVGVIFRDSTAQFLHPWIAEHFSRAVFVWHQGQVYEEVIARERPDVVLHMMAERFVTTLPAAPAFVPINAGSDQQRIR